MRNIETLPVDTGVGEELAASSVGQLGNFAVTAEYSGGLSVVSLPAAEVTHGGNGFNSENGTGRYHASGL